MSGMSTADAPAARTPGRPRSARADEAIIDAALDLLAEGSTVESLSIEAVAARAGVGKATIYRRWPGKNALICDAIRTLKGTPRVPDTGSLRADLVALLATVGANADPRAPLIMPLLVPEALRSSEQYQLYQDIIEVRREVMRTVLRRGLQRGELRDDVDLELVLLLLSAPVLIQRVLRWHPGLAERGLPEQVVDAVLAGVGTARTAVG